MTLETPSTALAPAATPQRAFDYQYQVAKVLRSKREAGDWDPPKKGLMDSLMDKLGV